MTLPVLLSVAIVAHSPGYDTSLANHIRRWLRQEDVAAKVVKPQEMARALADEKIAFLVGFGSPSADEMSALRAFRARGGSWSCSIPHHRRSPTSWA